MLIDGFTSLHPIYQALCGTLFTWFLTALGAGLVFFFKSINLRVLNGMLGFASGVMIAASYWSLLAPAIEMAEEAGGPAWVPAAVGFLAGGLFIWVLSLDAGGGVAEAQVQPQPPGAIPRQGFVHALRQQLVRMVA